MVAFPFNFGLGVLGLTLGYLGGRGGAPKDFPTLIFFNPRTPRTNLNGKAPTGGGVQVSKKIYMSPKKILLY